MERTQQVSDNGQTQAPPQTGAAANGNGNQWTYEQWAAQTRNIAETVFDEKIKKLRVTSSGAVEVPLHKRVSTYAVAAGGVAGGVALTIGVQKFRGRDKTSKPVK